MGGWAVNQGSGGARALLARSQSRAACPLSPRMDQESPHTPCFGGLFYINVISYNNNLFSFAMLGSIKISFQAV